MPLALASQAFQKANLSQCKVYGVLSLCRFLYLMLKTYEHIKEKNEHIKVITQHKTNKGKLPNRFPFFSVSLDITSASALQRALHRLSMCKGTKGTALNIKKRNKKR